MKKKENEGNIANKNKIMSKTSSNEYTNIIGSKRNNEGRNSVKPIERQYYRQEDLINFQFDSITSKNKANFNTKQVGADKLLISNATLPNKICESSPTKHQNFQSEIALNIPNS